MIKKLSLVPFFMVIILAYPQEGIAQVNIPDTIPGKGFFVGQLNLAKRIMDFFVDKRDASNAAKLDSNYIGYYPEKLQFSIGLAQNGGWLAVKDGENTYRLGSDITRSLSMRACYRGLAMVFALNPFNMFGNTDEEFDISFYGDKLVLDFVYQNSNSLSGTYKGVYTPTNQRMDKATEYSVDEGLFNRRTTMFGAMYVFNSRRFSYAAAFDQTCIQKRSCGSVLLGANYMYNRMRMDLQEYGNVYMRSRMLGIGGGYGYNLVLPKNWLISASALLEAGVWSRNKYEIPQVLADAVFDAMRKEGRDVPADYSLEESYSYDGLPLILIPRIAILRYFGRYYAGFTALGTSHYERYKGQDNFNFVFTSTLLFGMRL
jgi:hypothetical protein